MVNEYEKVQNASIGERLKFLIKDSVIYGGISSASKFLHIFLLPILTRLLSQEDYGIYDTLLIISNFALVLIIAGTDSSVARFFYETKDEEDKKELISQTLFIEIGLSFLFSFILWIGSDLILRFYFGSNIYAIELKILIISLPFIALVRFTQNVLKWIFKRKEFLFVSSGSIITTILLSIVFVTLISPEIKYLFYAQLLSMSIYASVGLYCCREYLKFPVSLNTIIPQLKFGLPFTANNIITAFVPALDRYFISTFLGLGTLGVYAVGNKISQLSQIAINGFQIAWGPLAYSIMHEKNSKETYEKIFNYYVFFVAIFILSFTFISPFLIKILAAGKYSSAIFITLILLVSKLIGSISGISAIGIGLSKKTYLNLIASISKLIFTTIFIYCFINLWGILGVAIGILAGNIIYVIILNIFAFNVSEVRFSYLHPIVLIFMSFSLSILSLLPKNFLLNFFITTTGMLLILSYGFYFLVGIEDKNKIIFKAHKLLGYISTKLLSKTNKT